MCESGIILVIVIIKTSCVRAFINDTSQSFKILFHHAFSGKKELHQRHWQWHNTKSRLLIKGKYYCWFIFKKNETISLLFSLQLKNGQPN